MKAITTSFFCSCGFGQASAEAGKPVKGLADHLREHEYERKMYGLHEQQTVEVWSSK